MTSLVKDVEISEAVVKTLLLQRHSDYIAAYGEKKDDYEYCMTEYLRMSGIYWGITVMDLMGQLDRMEKPAVLDFIQKCQHECGGVGASIGHDPHLLYTLSAIQVLAIYDAIETINVNKVVEYVSQLQKDDGSFAGDKWGEIDVRFSFCAVACLALLKRLDAINVDKAVKYVVSCMNFDGGFGSRPGAESHSGLIYCCVGLLAITGQLHYVNADLLGWWLCERQLPSGGLNARFMVNFATIKRMFTTLVPACIVLLYAIALLHVPVCINLLYDSAIHGPLDKPLNRLVIWRPEKLPDVCYSWWVLASLKIIGRLHWINREKLVKFILACQDDETGGFADRPGNMVDPFHTLFGIAGLSLLGDTTVKEVNPVYCMPESVIQRLRIMPQLIII